MADPRDVEAAREWWDGDWDAGEPGEAVRSLAALLSKARERERQACEQIVLEVSQAPWQGSCGGYVEILRRIRERSQPAPASQEGDQ